jgi:L-ascorbate oxidase
LLTQNDACPTLPTLPHPPKTKTANAGQPGDVFWISSLPSFRPGTPAGFAVLRYLNPDGSEPSTPPRLPASSPPQPGSVRAWTAADQARVRAPGWTVGKGGGGNATGLSPRSAAALPAGFADLRPPPTTIQPVRLSITQPLLAQTGQMRWAINNVATGGTPGCGAYLRDVRDRGGMRAVRDDAAATVAAGGPAADDDLLGKQTVSDATRVPTFLAGVESSSPPSSPTVGRLLIPADAGAVLDLVLDNLAANANGGDYRIPEGFNRTASEMHPVHWHGFHGWLLGTGEQGAGPFVEERDRPGLNTADPPLRDSVTVLPGSWVVVRLPLATPGAWLLHCHMHSHAAMGMAAVFGVGLDALPPQPDGFPACERECPSSVAPWRPGDVRAEWGHTNYDLGPEALPRPDAEGAVAPALNGTGGGRR